MPDFRLCNPVACGPKEDPVAVQAPVDIPYPLHQHSLRKQTTQHDTDQPTHLIHPRSRLAGINGRGVLSLELPPGNQTRHLPLVD